MSRLQVLSLFSGIGGLDLGLERAGMQIVAHSEIDSYACRVLEKHWPDVPNLGDITAVEWCTRSMFGWIGAYTDPSTRLHVGRVDVIAGGFPCQDISKVGKRVGIEGSKSGLWSEYARAVREIRPRYVIVENAADLVVRGLGIVLGDLASCGYRLSWRRYSAAEFGAPHDRRRTFIVANLDGEVIRLAEGPWPERPKASQSEQEGEAGRAHSVGSPSWGFTPDLGGMVHGVPYRVDRLRGLGNAVVPQVGEYIGQLVVEHHEREQAGAA